MVFRNSALPSPSEMRPLRSTMAIPPTSRHVANRLGITVLGPLLGCRARCRRPVISVARLRNLFRHDDLCATRAARHNVEFIHKGAHQKDPPPGGTQEI